MGIEVEWVNEKHEQKQIVGDSHGVLNKLALSRWPKITDSVCLRFIDPFGDTVFNQFQIPALIGELRTEIANQADLKFKSHLEKVLRLVEVSAGRTHTYIKFNGD